MDIVSNNLALQEIYECNPLVEVAAKIAIRNFEWRYTTFLIFNTTVICGVQVFMQHYDKNVELVQGIFEPNDSLKISQYVIFGLNVGEIELMLLWIVKHRLDNSGKYIIVCTSKSADNCNETQIVETLWKYRVINVVLLQFSSNKNVVKGHTYNFDKNVCRNGPPIQLNSLDTGIDLKECTNLFPEKLKNLHRCPLIVTVFEQMPYMSIHNGKPSGTDGDILGLIARGLNATLKVITPADGKTFGYPEPDGSWSGTFGDVHKELANFSMNSAAITLVRNKFFQISTEYDFKIFVWVTHPALTKPAGLKLFQPFQLTTHIAIVFSFLLVVICAIMTKTKIWRSISKSFPGKVNNTIVFDSWTICMGLPTKDLPKKPNLLWITFLWIWYCFLVRSYYQACLIQSLKGDTYYAELQSFEEVLKTDYRFGGVKALKDYFMDDPYVYKNWVSMTSQEILPMFWNLTAGKNFAFAINTDITQMFQAKFKRKLHVIPGTMIVSPKVLYFKKFSPLAEPINWILKRLVECGLVDKSKKQHAVPGDLYKKTQKTNAINISNFTGCYILMISGWLVSFAIFLLEIILFNYNKGLLNE